MLIEHEHKLCVDIKTMNGGHSSEYPRKLARSTTMLPAVQTHHVATIFALYLVPAPNYSQLFNFLTRKCDNVAALQPIQQELVTGTR